MSSIFSAHNGMKLEINHRKKNDKITNTSRLNNMLLKNQQVNDEINEEIREYLEIKEKKRKPNLSKFMLLLLSHFSHVQLCVTP